MNVEAFFHKNSFLPRLTPILCFGCVASFLGLNLAGANAPWERLKLFGYYPPDALWNGAPWALLTSTFAHIGPVHLLFNVLWLWTLGNAFENRYGSLPLAAFFLGAAWVSSALQLLLTGDTGIGMSGVGYALFGFGWIARRRVPEFAVILQPQTVAIFLFWLVGCIVVTQLGLDNIGNGAHVAGLAFGAAVAGLAVEKWRPPLPALGLAALLALSFVPLVWCPQSVEWLGLQALRAGERKDPRTALFYYNQVMARDPKATWALHNMALIYAQQGDGKRFGETLERLRQSDPQDAKKLEDGFKE